MVDSENKPEMKPRELKDGSGWYVFVRWGNRPAEQVGGFPSETEAQQWIDQAGTSWLKARYDEPRMF